MVRYIIIIIFILSLYNVFAQNRSPLKADRALQDVMRRENEIAYDNMKALLDTIRNDSAKVDLLIGMSYCLNSNLDEIDISISHISEAIKLSKKIDYKEGLNLAVKTQDLLMYTESFMKYEAIENDLKQAEFLIEKAELMRNFSIAVGGLIFLIALGLGFQYFYIKKTNKTISDEKKRSEELLLNILPIETARELKLNGYVIPQKYNLTTILFSDFKEFTKHAEMVSPDIIIKSLHYYFEAFDKITTKHDLEKIKTIGDSYMCVGGVPIPNNINPVNVVYAAIDMLKFVMKPIPDGLEKFEIRIGIHTGPIIAGIVGIKKFQYDVWGNAVNIASRMESNSEPQKINISKDTYTHVKEKFNCTYRGEVEVKHGKKIDMYYVDLE